VESIAGLGAPEGARVGASIALEGVAVGWFPEGPGVAGAGVDGAMVGSPTGAAEVGAMVGSPTGAEEVGAEVDGVTEGPFTGGAAVGDKTSLIAASVSSHTIIKKAICSSLAFWPGLEPEMLIVLVSLSLQFQKFFLNCSGRSLTIDSEISPPDVMLTNERYSL
jgi:hypothetical protein